MLALKASAGTGKTYALALRYLAKLFMEATPYDVLAITFTNKAANEMRERIGEFLQKLERDKELAQNLSHITGLTLDEINQRKEKVFAKFLRDDLLIMTIDSFVQRILRKFSYYGGVASDFEIGECEIFEQFLEELNEREYHEFISFALWYGAKVEEFFTTLYEKDKELPPPPDPLQDNTQKIIDLYNKIVAHVQIYGSDAKKKEYHETDDIDKILYTSNGIRAYLKKENCKIPGVKRCEVIEQEFQELKREITYYFAYRESVFLSLLYKFYSRYKELKLAFITKQNLLSFTDIKHITYDLLQHSIAKDFLYFRLDSKLAHIMIDEFQDTSVEDWKIFEPLVDEIAAGSGSRDFRSFFYVGDIKQSIYGFRGGKPELFDYVANRYNMQIEELDINYRSRENIVAYVNEEFDLEQKSVKEGGYVEVVESDETLLALEEKLHMLLEAGVASKDIAILVPRNDDVLKVAEFLEEKFSLKASTSISKLVIHQPFARAVIEAIKYLKDNTNTLALFHFCSITGEENIEDFELEKPVQLIRKICDRYELWDESTLTLMQEAVAYKDIEEFLLYIEELPTQMPSSMQHIEVLTIHKSKGLAFKHTIVLDVLGLDKPKYPKVIFDYDDITLQKLILRQKGREEFDVRYKEILQKAEQKEQKELHNVAYVALTRAIDSLIVIKKPKSRRFGFLHTTKRGVISPQNDSSSYEELQDFSLPLRYYGKQEFIEEQEYKPNEYAAIYKGEAIHKGFEIGVDYVKSRYKVFVDVDDIDQIIQSVQDDIEKHFKGEFYKEIPFVHKQRLGIIDLLIRTDSGYVVIDYKSVRPADESGYIRQVSFYKEAIKMITGQPCQGYLYYIDQKLMKKV
ncbi:RecB-like helicase [Nitratiruptor sp. YY09-18]|uniref:RecB-like helicase n=1 Tax=Nitratiruptor sp. YY09-18 TaxID=2724901 RepID=UPI001F402F8F|nr:RecB-like helicase [Nitratiruptor sp. YY09-18]